MEKYIKDAIVSWYKKEYEDKSNILYNEDLKKKENIHCNKINTPFGELYCFHASPSTIGCKPTILLRLENENINISKDNISLFKELMSKEDLAKYKSLI